MTILGADDDSLTIVPASSWTIREHIDVYLRAVALSGAQSSDGRDAPVHGPVMMGVAVRY